MKRELLINVSDYETRIALMEDDRLVEVAVERPENERMVGDIYKGRVSKVLPGMQAAFVEIGWEKAAFLHASDMGNIRGDNGRYDGDTEDGAEEGEEEAEFGEIVRKKRRETIESALKEKAEILVQVIKEPIGSKGPRVATDISIPGRYVVLVPDSADVRVSKKITNWNERRRLRKIAAEIRPEGFGLICRTESDGKSEKDLGPDVKRLIKMWTRLKKKTESSRAPALIHKEEGMTTSTLRDILNDSIDRVLVDDRREYRELAAYVRQVTPNLRGRIELYKGDIPLFDAFKVEHELEKTMERQVWIKRGAYLIIDQTEAMITIDVNTGRFVGRRDQEETIFQTNMEAAREIARQIRLRDLGGLIVCDFIDMYNRDNRRRLYEEFRHAMENDRAKKALGQVTDFGLVELTRERVRPSLAHRLSEPCPCCRGFGRVLSKETMSAKIDRWFIRASGTRKYGDFHLVTHPSIAEALVSKLEDAPETRLRTIMKRHDVRVNLVRDATLSAQEFRVYDATTNTEITSLYNVATNA